MRQLDHTMDGKYHALGKTRFAARLAIFLCIAVCAVIGAPARGQADGPYYLVQSGDSLWGIALQFGVSYDELVAANGNLDSSGLQAGAALIIPGLAGYAGPVATARLGYGETLTGLARRFGLEAESLLRLNRLTNPDELYAGANLVIPADRAPQPVGRRVVVGGGSSLLETAALNGENPWTLAVENGFDNTWQAIPGAALYASAAPTEDGPGGLPAPISAIEINALPAVQGKTTVIRIHASPETTFSGSLLEKPLNFFPAENGQWIALQGIHAMTEPGFYPLVVEGILPGGAGFSFEQSIYVNDGGYTNEIIDLPEDVAAATLDPAVTGPENDLWFSLTAPATSEKYWDGLFLNPSPFPLSAGFPSVFGNRRSYNGSAYDYYHSGLDMYGNVGVEIYTPADGVVVYTGTLTVRGGATVIDHGWGVYTTYMHQSEIRVAVGEKVTAGQVIGLIGASGRAQGPHLHFEVWVGNIAVDPLDWLTALYP